MQKEKSMKNRTNRKARVLCLAMAFAMLSPLVAFSQRGSSQEGLFGRGGGAVTDRQTVPSGSKDYGLSNQQFGSLGGGVAILLAAGMGYAGLKRRKERE